MVYLVRKLAWPMLITLTSPAASATMAAPTCWWLVFCVCGGRALHGRGLDGLPAGDEAHRPSDRVTYGALPNYTPSGFLPKGKLL
jgi:hypothetical protein